MTSGERTPQSWARPSTTDTADNRRRVSRARIGGSRISHPSTRLNSASSARNQTHPRHSSDMGGFGLPVGPMTTHDGGIQAAPLAYRSLGGGFQSNYMPPGNPTTSNTFVFMHSPNNSPMGVAQHNHPINPYGPQPQVFQEDDAAAARERQGAELYRQQMRTETARRMPPGYPVIEYPTIGVQQQEEADEYEMFNDLREIRGEY